MPGSNSTISLQEIVDDAQSIGDLAPALATGGYVGIPALSIANDVISAMLLGGPTGQPLNWKWNRINVRPFPTISYQQDYFVPDVFNVGWLEYAWASNINQTSVPKQKQDLEVHRDLEVTYQQTGSPGKICWIPNDQCQTGTWGATPLGPTANNPSGDTISIGVNLGGLQNPGPGVIYTNPVGPLNAPINATTCITDPNGNLWLLTTYGTCGTVQPTWPTTPSYPTLDSPNTVSTTVTDGTCVWTAINPKGQGFRLNPIPPQTGVVWMIQVVAQMRQAKFKTLSQTLEPIPDDYATYFKQGFFAQCYRRNPDPKVRARFADEWKLWLDSLDKAIKAGQREPDDVGFYPGSQIMETGWGFNPIRPDLPFGPWCG
jgi:hypothetical protein